MRQIKYKCYACGRIVDEIKIAHDYNEGDYLKCPACGAIEPGFSEVIVDESKGSDI